MSSVKVCGIICRRCGNTLPPHTEEEHFDVNHCVHSCPHIISDLCLRRQQRIECYNKNSSWLMSVETKKGKGSKNRRTFINALKSLAYRHYIDEEDEYLWINKFGRGIWTQNLVEAFNDDQQKIIIDEIAEEYGAFSF